MEPGFNFVPTWFASPNQILSAQLVFCLRSCYRNSILTKKNGKNNPDKGRSPFGWGKHVRSCDPTSSDSILATLARTAQFSQKTERNHNSGEEPNCHNGSLNWLIILNRTMYIKIVQTVYFIKNCYTIIFWFHISESFFVSLTSTPNISHQRSLPKPLFSLFVHSLYSSSNCATGFRRRRRDNKPLHNFTLPTFKWGTQHRLDAPTTTPNQAIGSEQQRRAIDGGNDDEGIADVREKLMHDL